jgi:GYF domain 2
MSDTWFVNVQGRAYGPYSEAQMEGFVAEGRLAAHSLVTRAGETEFRSAGDEPVFATLFQQQQQLAVAEAVVPAEPAAAPISSFGRHDVEPDAVAERAHFIIVADMKSRSVQGLEEEIYNLGPAYAILPQVWILSTEQTVNTVRNLLIQKLGKLDVLFVVDAAHNKAAWFNFGPEADSRIRRIWAKAQDAAKLAASA